MLNLPGEALVLQDDFLNMLDRLDLSLEYLKNNRDFHDAEIYLIRFQQCLTRAMTLIKMYFVSVVRKLSSEVGDKMVGKVSPFHHLQTGRHAHLWTIGPLRNGGERAPVHQVLQQRRDAAHPPL